MGARSGESSKSNAGGRAASSQVRQRITSRGVTGAGVRAMYLFTRSRKFAPNNATDAVAWSVETAGKATQICGLPVTAWGSMWGEDAGTVTWSAFVDDLAALEEAGDKLAVDSGFNQRLADAEAMFVGPVIDALA